MGDNLVVKAAKELSWLKDLNDRIDGLTRNLLRDRAPYTHIVVSIEPGWSWSCPCYSYEAAMDEVRLQAKRGNRCTIKKLKV